MTFTVRRLLPDPCRQSRRSGDEPDRATQEKVRTGAQRARYSAAPEALGRAVVVSPAKTGSTYARMCYLIDVQSLV